MNARVWSGKSFGLIAFIFASAAAIHCGAQDAQEGTVNPGASITNSQTADSIAVDARRQKATERRQLGKRATSSAVREVMRMLDAGVSKEVVKTYVESAPLRSQPTPLDMIALKEGGVPDEITVALLKRSAELAQQVQRSQPQAGAIADSQRQSNSGYRGYLDPESYEYFQYYYLYPRTLAHAYNRLGYYSSPYYPGSGYYGAPGPFFPYLR